MTGGGDDDEGCAAACRKIRSAALTYGGSFLAVGMAFVAFDIAAHSAPMKDPSDWVEDFKVDIWFGPRAYVYQILQACIAAAVISFTMELFCILMTYGNVYAIVKYAAIVNAILILVFTIPICTVGFALSHSLFGASETAHKISGSYFNDYHSYLDLAISKNGTQWDKTLGNRLFELQEKLDWLQRDYTCCGVNSTDDYKKLNPHLDFRYLANGTKPKDVVPHRLHWWFAEKGQVRLPHSCCKTKHEGQCHKESAFRLPCKQHVLELLVRCILFSCGLLVGSALFGLIGAVLYFRTARIRIMAQKRYHQWLVKTGQLTEDDDAD